MYGGANSHQYPTEAKKSMAIWWMQQEHEGVSFLGQWRIDLFHDCSYMKVVDLSQLLQNMPI